MNKLVIIKSYNNKFKLIITKNKHLSMQFIILTN